MKNRVIYFFIFFNSFVFSQTKDNIVINGEIKNAARSVKVVIKKFGVGFFDVAEAPIVDNKFSIVAPADIEPGVYRFQYEQSVPTSYIDVIINGSEKEIQFQYDASQPKILPVFEKSEENRNWYNYRQTHSAIQEFLGIEYQFLANYPNKEHKIYKKVKQVYQDELKSIFQLRDKFIKSNPGYYATSMVINFPFREIYDPKEHFLIHLFNEHENYWNEVDTNNPKLLNTPLYTEHILEYLKYYLASDVDFTEQQIEEGLIKSVDTIISKFKNEETRKFAIKYLQLGFKEIGQEKVLQYIDEKYASVSLCESDIEKTELQQRISGYEALKPGTLSPNITFVNQQGETTSLHDIKTDKIVIVFWSSECPHCMETMPKINEWAKNKLSNLIIAVSIDENKESYYSAIKQLTNIQHFCDFKGWESDFVKSFYVYATPTIVIIDKTHKIIGKYANWEEVK